MFPFCESYPDKFFFLDYYSIPNEVGEIAIYRKENSGSVRRLEFSKLDASELDTLFTPGIFVDAFFSVDPYDYQQNAGIRLVAKKLIIHSGG